MTDPAAEAEALVQGERRKLAEPGRYEAEVFISSLNQRVRVLSFQASDHAALAAELIRLTQAQGLSKLFLKARAADAAPLTAAGLTREAVIEGYFDGEDAVVLSHFLTEQRAQRSADAEELRGLEALVAAPVPERTRTLSPGYDARCATAADAEELARLYKEVFGTYPFPIFDPAYLIAVMQSHVVFLLVRDEAGRLVAAASAEVDAELRSAEMTDFATHPSQRGKGLALFLLEGLEAEMGHRGVPNLFTLARSSIMGMNKVFHHLGYRYTGRLVKNCHIGGAFEDMLCWCKRLEPRG